jgi:DNA-binding XRE family transcriptional regulator
MTPDSILSVHDNQIRKYQPPKIIKSEHMELMCKIGSKLIELRRGKKISSSGLAKQVGISRNAYHMMEAGKVYFNVMSIMQILDYHQISVPDFFNDLT